MALKLDYVLGETVSNLKRNFLMSTAAVLTAAVSLSLFGGALLIRKGVDRATLQWKDGAELHIFMNADATQQQVDAVKAKLDASLDVKSARYLDRQAAFEEAKQLFANDPAILSALTIDRVPPSFRVVPTNTKLIESIGGRFSGDAGVKRVVYAVKAIKTMEFVTRMLQIGLLAIAVVLLVSATLLILNAIRIAIFARRREVAVMKLVGATNWFIRIPFMLEGLLQGLLGALFAVGVVFLMQTLMKGFASSGDGANVFARIVVTTGETVQTSILVVLVGMAVGVIGSIAAVHRFLDT